MKKRIIVMALVFCLTLSNSMLAFATEKDNGSGNDTNKGTSEQMLQSENGESESSFVTDEGAGVYEAYVTYEEAVAAKSLEDLRNAQGLLDNALYTLEQGGDEAFFEDVDMMFSLLPIGEGDDDVFTTVTEFYRTLGYKVGDFIALAEAYEAYLEEVTVESCETFFGATQSDYTEYTALAELFEAFYDMPLEEAECEVGDAADELYAEELTNARKVANAYEGMKNTFLYGGDAVIQMAIEQFPETLEVLETMTDAELEELAEYLGVESGEEAFKTVYARWESVQAFVEFPALYAAYEESGSAEDAEQLIACYEKIEMDFTKELLADKYENIESIMETAAETVKPVEKYEEEGTVTKDEPPAVEEPEAEQTENGYDAAPETGDEALLFPFAVLFIAAVMTLFVMRKNRV